MANLRNTEVARVLERHFDEIAQGNEGDAEIERLDLDGDTLSFRVKIRHRHTWKKPFGGGVIVVYDVTTYAEGNINPRNPDPASLRVCVETPTGQICITLEDVIAALVAAGLL